MACLAMTAMRTPEQIAAENRFETALVELLRHFKLVPDGFALGDWIVGVELQGFAPETANLTNYVQLIPGEGIPLHRIIGLLQVTEERLTEG